MNEKISVTAACTLANAYVGMPGKFGKLSWQVFYREHGETATRTIALSAHLDVLTGCASKPINAKRELPCGIPDGFAAVKLGEFTANNRGSICKEQ